MSVRKQQDADLLSVAFWTHAILKTVIMAEAERNTTRGSPKLRQQQRQFSEEIESIKGFLEPQQMHPLTRLHS